MAYNRSDRDGAPARRRPNIRRRRKVCVFCGKDNVIDYKDYNGYLYTSFKNQKMNGLLCADVAGIKGSLKISHDCTEAQYTALKEKLSENGADWLCETTSPDTADYPDLSMYLTFVISSDELHEIWKSLGLE